MLSVTKAEILSETIASAYQGDAEKLFQRILSIDRKLFERFSNVVRVDPALTRQLVSFQANKTEPFYRWYKFKEAFSAPLVEYLLSYTKVRSGRILDPFAGSGTALFSASSIGLNADGIELLPVGQSIISAKLDIWNESIADLTKMLGKWIVDRPWKFLSEKKPLPTLNITRGAYPRATEESIERYLALVEEQPSKYQSVLMLALLSVVEAVSYTRKDGQYLRWDDRSGRRLGSKKTFTKGPIPSFDDAITAKLQEMYTDRSRQLRFEMPLEKGDIRLFKGSVFKLLPTLPHASYDAIITSPPYCNRYDYTRTYALELALLGVGEKELLRLRQEMLSSTVENRAKNLLAFKSSWSVAVRVADQETLLQAILDYLEALNAEGKLNNKGIPRMIRGYFYEMACIIYEAARVLKPGAPFIMVNDNVRYAGASISVDFILSHLAEMLGFYVDEILVLPNGKGNSSQQMGQHGKDTLRKGVYIWRKI